MKKNRTRFFEKFTEAELEDSQAWTPEGPAFADDWQEDFPGDAPEVEKPEPHSIFRPRVKQPNFILSVLVNAVRIFAVLILVLLVRPAGLLGRYVPEKV